jgi:branched-chain amino acid transport system permease protein
VSDQSPESPAPVLAAPATGSGPGAVPPWRTALASFLRGQRLRLLLPAIGAVLLLLYPLNGSAYWVHEIELILVLTLVVSGVNLSFGYAGEVQFGQVFILALSAYVTMILAIHGLNDVLLLLVIGAVVAFVAGLIIALPALRIGGWSLAMASFFLVVTLPDFVAIAQKYTGGLNGLVGIPTPELFGRALGTNQLYWVTAVVAIAWMLLFRNFVTSRYGVIFRLLRHSPTLSQSLGFSTFRLKTLAYAFGALPAGLAGCLLGYISQILTPDTFSLSTAIGVTAASVLGGIESVYGALVGAALLQLGPENSTSFAEYAPVVYGLFLVFAAVLLRSGVGGLARSGLSSVARRIAPVARPPEPADVPADDQFSAWAGDKGEQRPTARLTVSSVSKSYGGVRALNEVSLTADPGHVTALIGSNGSGKTTLLNVICGFAAPTAGAVVLGEDNLVGLSPARVARHGIGRTFQTPAIPAGVSVLDTVAAGGFYAEPCGVVASMFRWRSHYRSRAATLARAHRYLSVVGLDQIADEDASSLALGTRRLVEVARALCAHPRLLLLDEPASGLSNREVERLGRIVRLAAADGVAVVLIEHNFGFVSRVSDVVHVLHLGELIATGSPEEVRQDPHVVDSYLGESAHAADGGAQERAAAGRERAASPEAAAEPMLVLSDAISGYGDLRVIDGVNLTLYPGRIEVVLGRNGVGKTTLLGTIAGQVRLWEGSLTVGGISVARRKTYRRASAGIALVQEGKRIFAQRTVWQNLVLGTHSLRVSNAERHQVCRALVEQFPMLEPRLKDRAGSLSGGQQQMLAIAQALAARPRVLLLDEPSAGLAPAIIDDLFARIRDLADGGLAVLLVEQLAERAVTVADHVTVLDGGRIVSSGPPSEFQDREGLQRVYLSAGWEPPGADSATADHVS